MKQQHVMFGLIGVGAVVVLYVLWRESQQAQIVDPNAIPEQDAPHYPNVQPIKLGDVTINDATPTAQSYNVPVDGSQFNPVSWDDGSAHSECGCRVDDCEGAGNPVTVQHVPAHVLKNARENLQSFLAKTPVQVSGVEAARVTLSQPGTPNTVAATTGKGGTLAA